MRLSNKCQYAIRALFDIAYHGEGDPVSGREIAAREEIPQRFLEQILLELKRARLVTSKRGPRGGYLLGRSPAEISMLDIIETIDGPMIVDFCYPTDEEARMKCQIKNKCVTSSVWRDVVGVVRAHLTDSTLVDMVRRGADLGVCRENDDAMFYVI